MATKPNAPDGKDHDDDAAGGEADDENPKPPKAKAKAKSEPVAASTKAKEKTHASHDAVEHTHSHDDPKLAHKTSHGATKKEIFQVFYVLVGLTAVELGVVYLPIPKRLIVIGLIGLALAKAYTVAMYYMHLKGETKIMKYMIYLPMAAPTLYAVVLMFEAAFRYPACQDLWNMKRALCEHQKDIAACEADVDKTVSKNESAECSGVAQKFTNSLQPTAKGEE